MVREKKPKTRAIPFDNWATETRPGWWEWDLGGRRWAFRDGGGINLYAVESEEAGRVLTPVVSVPTLKEAALFAEGFRAGWAHASWRTASEGSTNDIADLVAESSSDDHGVPPPPNIDLQPS